MNDASLSRDLYGFATELRQLAYNHAWRARRPTRPP